MKKIPFIIMCIMILSGLSYAQNNEQLFSEAARVYTGTDGSLSGLIGGFSIWGLFGGFIFGMIGMAAFIYGKKNSAFKPMLIGIILMVYPYFIRNTVVLCLVGLALCAALYFL